MKTTVRSILVAALLATLPPAAKAVNPEDEQLLNVVKELTAKQAQLTENEGKIESKVSDLAETVRVARLFMSRAGGTHKPIPPVKK